VTRSKKHNDPLQEDLTLRRSRRRREALRSGTIWRGRSVRFASRRHTMQHEPIHDLDDLDLHDT
jgi:hypothetical protein